MSKETPSTPSDLTTIGFTPFLYNADQAFFNVRAGIHAWAAHYLTVMGKALIDDVIQALIPRPARTKTESEAEMPESL
ncbi:DUF3077 domain-containing protein [Pseudomonas atacamensis]|uniref:DUF3077 domain-containing protein n=1 Tax=Pseudomonas atacamensis TaxID=2565368 RepID=UPI0024807845|nr:DUF3077 domain-containing protein [Pseudomonas atacamensis]WGT33015.1 DUF3077 domain-containing protein [Pseudomonas atacamensis]